MIRTAMVRLFCGLLTAAAIVGRFLLFFVMFLLMTVGVVVLINLFTQRAHGAEPTFYKYKASVPYNAADPFADVRAHTVNWSNWGNVVTDTHENTHEVNNQARESATVPRGSNCFYVLRDRLYVTRDPKRVTLADLQYHLIRKRGEIITEDRMFNDYVVGGQKAPPGGESWNDTPTYIIDEAVAYTNGAIAGARVGSEWWEGSAKYATRLSAYSLDLCDVIEAKEDAKLAASLRLFILWNWNRIPKPIYVRPTGPRPSDQHLDRWGRPVPPPSPLINNPWGP